MALILAAQRELPRFFADQSQHSWAPNKFVPGLADKHVLMIGYGGVGQAIAARLEPFEIDLTVVATRARTAENGTSVHGMEELPELLPHADIVILAVPLTDSTRHLADDAFFALMPEGSLVVNIARGLVADTNAIRKHAGRLRFALDVTAPEPLPSEHPLWDAEGVLISPHAAAATDAMRPRVVRLLRRQIERMLAGREPLNIVIRT
ncbi:MAG: NAD(P)-dependent oxidoreductase [Gulosibacter sp.]|uniref:NAD(P)-dependent oxidoreductase n=1 Tax=Gulosibacter sp. TaxID=2817531 RepID=UPI003F93B070